MAWFLTLFLHHGIIMFFDQVLNQTCSSTGNNQLPVLHSITLLRILCKNAGLTVLEFPICILSALSLYDYGISKPNFLQLVLKNNWLQIIHCPIKAFTVIQVGYDYWESPINGWHLFNVISRWTSINGKSDKQFITTCTAHSRKHTT